MTSPRSRTPLSRPRVLAAATRIADRDGLAAVTMRRVAAELGVEAMSLYHHLPGKDAVLAGLAESVIAEVVAEAPEHDSSRGWQEQLRSRCLSARTVMLRHPWAPGLITSLDTIPQVAYVHYEAILSILIDGGFSYSLAHRALHALGSMALGFVQEVFSPAEAGDADPTEDEIASLAAALPHLAAMLVAELHDSREQTLGFCDSQREFEFTLDLILGGLSEHHTRGG